MVVEREACPPKLRPSPRGSERRRIGSFPSTDAAVGRVGVLGPDGHGGTQVGVFVAHVGDGARAGPVDLEANHGTAALDKAGGGNDVGLAIEKLGGHLQENDPAGIVGGVIGGGHAVIKTLGGFKVGASGEIISGPGAVFGVPGNDGGADGLDEGIDLGFFGGFHGAADGGDGEAGEHADDGDDDEEFDEGKRTPARSAGWIRIRIRLEAQKAGGGRREAGRFWILDV